MDAYGGFAKGMPKKRVKLPLAEPMKFFESWDTSISAKQKSQGAVTHRIVQPDHRSSVGCSKGGANKDKISQTQHNEHDVVPGTRRGERGMYASR